MAKKISPVEAAPPDAPDTFKKELGELLTRHGFLLHPVPYIDEEGRIRATVGVVPATQQEATAPTIQT